jgi:phosphoenolpyruvate---glycerone phosphotransferase subunit DhaL
VGESFTDAAGLAVVREMIAAIRSGAAALSEIDGAIGDGDHGVNMAKGFALCGQRLDAAPPGFAGALGVLGDVLLTDIGGAMGPLYGTLFGEMSAAARGSDTITAEVMQAMLDAAVAAVVELGGARVGDKTMVDALAPAAQAFARQRAAGAAFSACCAAMAAAAETGRDSTRGLVARLGRASRLGERSRGVLDAGAASAALLLRSMADSIARLLDPGQ